MLKNLGYELWAKMTQFLRSLPSVTKWRNRHGGSAVQAELVESIRKTFVERGESSEFPQQGFNLSRDPNLIDSDFKQKVFKLNLLLEDDSSEANESDYHSQIKLLLQDMEVINESNHHTIEQKNNLLFEKADKILTEVETVGIKQNYSLPSGTAAKVELLLSESSRNYSSLATLYKCVTHILRNVNNKEDYLSIVDTFEAFKSVKELLVEKFNVFKNEIELLGKIKDLADLYLLAISGMKNPSNWSLEFRSVCKSIVSIIEDRENSELIPFEIEGETIYLSPESAEGKALQRIDAINAGEKVEWRTTIRQGDLIDEDDLDRWLTKRGYSL